MLAGLGFGGFLFVFGLWLFQLYAHKGGQSLGFAVILGAGGAGDGLGFGGRQLPPVEGGATDPAVNDGGCPGAEGSELGGLFFSGKACLTISPIASSAAKCWASVSRYSARSSGASNG